MREITLSQAVNEALAEEMRRDETVFIIGEDVAEAGTPFKVLSGLVEEFGTARVVDTPIAEPGFMGIAVGAAMTGSRPVVDLMFGDFIFLIMDQLCNQAAKTHYMSGGKLNVPLVLRTNLGATRRSAAQHSQSLHALVAHIPGLKVALPSSAYEAKGLMKTAIRDNNPVVIFEDKLMYQEKGRRPGRGVPDPVRRRQCKARRLRHYPDRHVFDGTGRRKGGRNPCRGGHQCRSHRSRAPSFRSTRPR
jgi:pyruvate/2-oxoglutarate/acetoin dehydrogenase E1 component